MRRPVLLIRAGVVVALALSAAACEKETPVVPSGEVALGRNFDSNAARNDLLKSVRQATSRFNSTTQAIKEGYEPSDHCVSHPELGGMGYHWLNPSLLDGEFEPLRPEIMLYAPGRGGNLRLVGVEYIVLAGEGVDLAGPSRPRFGDQPFDIGGTPIPVPHWSLHVWVHEQNPSGTFVPFNPNVSCPAH
jgi:hypothetical protein